jgi:hypothetical protein
MAKVLRKEIRDHLAKVLKMKPNSLSVRLAETKRTYPHATPAAAAQIFAQKSGKSIMGFLTEEDKKSLPSVHISSAPATRTSIPKSPMKSSRKQGGKLILIFATTDRFVERHIEEINATYNAHCYTATFMLSRKVIENLIIEILKKQFPNNTDKALYEDAKSHRFLDFSVVLDNLYKKRTTFSTTAKAAIERLNQNVKPFKKDANDKAHSLFHVASKSEIDGANVQEIFDLLSKIVKEVSLSS